MERAQGVKWPWADFKQSTCTIVKVSFNVKRHIHHTPPVCTYFTLFFLSFQQFPPLGRDKREVHTDRFYFCIIHNATGLPYILKVHLYSTSNKHFHSQLPEAFLNSRKCPLSSSVSFLLYSFEPHLLGYSLSLLLFFSNCNFCPITQKWN